MDQLPFSLDEVVINSELLRRPSRSPDREAENEALLALAQTLADSPEMILSRLVETALLLCRADTAGISLLEKHNGAEVFRWEALAGVFSDRLNNRMPRYASPCGTTIDRNTTQLMYMAERFFPALKAEPPVVEALLIPFHIENKPIGTVWVVAHNEDRKFDREDERIIKTLAQFASAGWKLWKARADAVAAARTEQEQNTSLAVANEALQAHIGERQRAEQQLQQVNKELERRVEERTVNLVKANADLLRMLKEEKSLQDRLRQAQKMESIGTLAGGLAHDFNNLLNIIQGYASLIVNRPTDPDQLVEDVQVIQATVQDGAALVRQLLTIARKTEGKFDLTDINALIGSLTKILKKTFPEGVTVALDLDPEVRSVLVDANQINQAVLNLCINARDAMADGGTVRLQTRIISGAEIRYRFQEATAERYARISVADTGLGMQEGTKSRVFEPFFTTKEPGKGTGLGLSVVYGIVGNHGGFVDLISEPGRGSTFLIYLPIQKAQTASIEITPDIRGKKNSNGSRTSVNDSLRGRRDEAGVFNAKITGRTRI